MKNILVCIDFDDNEKLLIDKAYEFGKVFNSKIWLMHIAAPEPDFVGFEVGPQYIRDDRASELRSEHQRLQEYSSNLIKKGVDADGLLIQGATAEMVIEESKKLAVDLIILGHNEHGFLYKIFVGSVADDIINKSKIPVLLIPL